MYSTNQSSSVPTTTSTDSTRQQAPVTVRTLHTLRAAGEPIAMLTAYDACFAGVLDRAGIDVILVGDSLGMVVQGRETTVPVTLDDMVYHAGAVARGASRPLRVVDMPFMSCATIERALDAAAQLMQRGQAQMVKIEGGARMAPVIEALAREGVPVCAHIGLLPQAVHKLGGYRVQGKDQASAQQLFDDARSLEQAGADLMLVECIPAALSEQLVTQLSLPLIGIGAGVACDGQVLVVYDMLGLGVGRKPRFVRNFMAEAGGDIEMAVRAYVDAVKTRRFPAPEHAFA